MSVPCRFFTFEKVDDCNVHKREITVKIFFDISRFIETNLREDKFSRLRSDRCFKFIPRLPRSRTRGDRRRLSAYFFTFVVLTLWGRGRKYNPEWIRSARGRYSV